MKKLLILLIAISLIPTGEASMFSKARDKAAGAAKAIGSTAQKFGKAITDKAKAFKQKFEDKLGRAIGKLGKRYWASLKKNATEQNNFLRSQGVSRKNLKEGRKYLERTYGR